jgi:hypothetical protein
MPDACANERPAHAAVAQPLLLCLWVKSGIDTK